MDELLGLTPCAGFVLQRPITRKKKEGLAAIRKLWLARYATLEVATRLVGNSLDDPGASGRGSEKGPVVGAPACLALC